MNKQQVARILRVLMYAVLVMCILEYIFSIKAVTEFCMAPFNNDSYGPVLFYCIVWAVMFLQVTILNIPGYSVLVICNSLLVGGVFNLTFILVTMSAYMAGVCLAYWLGRKFGTKAVKWCAGSDEDFDKWSSFINHKGKWFYFGTVLLPIFPDDLLCIVAGATHMKFRTYFLMNLVGRGIGLTTMCACLGLLTKWGIMGGDFPVMVFVWAGVFLALLISVIILDRRIRRGK